MPNEIPQEIMDKIERLSIDISPADPTEQEKIKNALIDVYHLRDQEVLRWQQMCDSTNQTNQALVKRLQEQDRRPLP